MVKTTKSTSKFNRTKDKGEIELSKHNNCNHITSKGIGYEKHIDMVPSKEYEVYHFAGTSLKEIAAEMIKTFPQGESLQICSFSLFDRTCQDWNSDAWKLGFGGTLYFIKGEDNFSSFTKELSTAIKAIAFKV